MKSKLKSYSSMKLLCFSIIAISLSKNLAMILGFKGPSSSNMGIAKPILDDDNVPIYILDFNPNSF
jgi:hypothetical protein